MNQCGTIGAKKHKVAWGRGLWPGEGEMSFKGKVKKTGERGKRKNEDKRKSIAHNNDS